MQKQEVKRYIEKWASLALEYKMKQGKGEQSCQENTQVIANTIFQQHKRWFYTWTSPDGQYQNQIDYSLCSQRWRNSILSAKTRTGVDCGSDHQLLIAKFRLKLKKVGNQELTGVIGKFGLGVQNEAGQRLTEFCQEDTLVITNTLFQQNETTRWLFT